MADSTRIEELLSAKSIKDFDELKLRVDASVASVEQLTLKAVQLNTALGSVKSPKDFNSTIKEIEQAEKSLLESTRKLAVEQGKLNNATNLQNQKKEINDLIIKNKELTNQLKEQQLAKQQQAASEKAASAQRKADLQNEKIANEERISLLRQEQSEMDALLKKTEALDRAEEDRLTNNAVASQPQAGQEPRAAQQNTPFVASTEIQKSAALVKSYQTSLANVKAEQIALNTQLKAGTITQGQYDAQLNKLIIDENRFKIALSNAQSSLTLANKANEFAKGSLQQRQIALERLNKSYSLIAPIDRNTAASQRQLGIIQRLTKQVGDLEQAQGKFGRQVGDYEKAAGGFSKIGAAAGKAFGVVRQLAYLIPGIGIGGIFALALEPIANFITKTFGASEASKRAAAALEAEQEALQGLVDGYRDRNALQDAAAGSTAAELSRVETLGKVLLDATNSQKERNRALLELQAINKNYFGDLTTEKNGLEAVKKALDEYTQAFVLQAIIKEVESDIGKVGAAYFKQARAVKAATLEVIENDKATTKSNADFIKTSKARAFILDSSSNSTAKLTINLKKQQEAAKPLADQYDQLNGFLKDLQLQALNFKPLTGGESQAKAQGEKLKAIKKQFDDEGAQDEANALKQIAKNDDYYITIRIKNRERAFKLEEDLRQRSTQNAIDNAKAELDAALEAQIKRGKGGDKNAILNAENKYNNDLENINREAEKKRVELAVQESADILFIHNSFNLKRREQDAKDNADALAQFTKAAEDKKKAELEAISSRAEREVNGIDADRDNQLRIINDTANARIEAAKGNSDKITNIEKQAALDSLQVTIDAERLKISVALNAQQQLLAIAKKSGNQDDISKLTAKIKELEKQLSELTNKELKLKVDVDSTGLDKVISTLEKISDIYGKLSSIVSDAFQANATAEKNQIQDQIDLLDQKTKTEIDGVNATTASEQDKAAKIAIINARTDAQKRQYELRQRQVDERKAQFDKAAAIGQIIIQTALAVTKALPVIPLAVLAGALGAAQLAVAIATPIPHYETGTTDAKGGWSLVGEKRKELVVTPEGRMIETPGTPTIMNIPKHSIVFPDSRKLMEGGIGRREIAAMKRQDRGELFYMLGGKMDKIGRIIKDKTETHFHQKGNNWEKIKKSGGNTTRYIS